MLISSADSNLYPDILQHVQKPLIIRGEFWEGRQKVPTLPSSNVAPHFTHQDCDYLWHCPGAK
jgi:hypothetical protein